MLLIWTLLSFLVGLAASAGNHTQISQGELMTLLGAMPKCGLTCLSTAVAASPCKPTDLDCSCNNATISAQVEACVTKSCTIRHQLTTKNTTATLCQLPIRDQTGIIAGTGVGGCVIMIIAYVLRMASKVSFPCEGGIRFISCLWWDDVVMTFAVLEISAVSACSVVLSNMGLGKDIWTLPFENITEILKVYYFDEDLYLTALPAIKISMCLTYLRIFQSKTFRIWVYLAIALNVAYGIAFTLVSVWQCTCNNINAQGWTSALFNVVLDIMTLSLPLPMLMKMNLNWRKKTLVMIMFSLGFFVTIVSIVRLQVMVAFGGSKNITWDYRSVGYWSTIEMHAGVVCACMPAIRNLIRSYMPRLMGSTVEESKDIDKFTGLSGNTAVEPTGKTDHVLKRHSDETHIIELKETGPRDRAATPGHQAHPSDGSWHDNKSEHSHIRPVSPLAPLER